MKTMGKLFIEISILSEIIRQLIVKIMKGDESFRQKSKAFLQSANEVFVYKTIIPHFDNYIADCLTSTANWTANVFFADCDNFSTLGAGKETVLALEDLGSLGFQLSSSKIDLDEEHLRIMAMKIATYHAVSFAMKLREDPMLEKLASGLIPFHFKSEIQGDLEAYKYLCPISFERLFNYIFASPKYQADKKFITNVSNLKRRVEQDFLTIMEDFLKVDHDFAVLLHGDYYRNNVMFKYETRDDKKFPVDLRMFDFQETRFATIAIDLSIFMFMHVPASLKLLIWDQLLELYHETLMSSLLDILKWDKDDERLSPYSYTKFIDHFEKFAFYGVAVSVLSIPWMASPEEDTRKISDFFENDMYHPDFKKLLQVCGGEDINERMVDNLKHASDKKYLKIFE